MRFANFISKTISIVKVSVSNFETHAPGSTLTKVLPVSSGRAFEIKV